MTALRWTRQAAERAEADPEVARRFEELARAGHSATSIAARIGRATATVHAMSARLGVPIANRAAPPVEADPEVAARFRALAAEGLTIPEIARRLCIGTSTAYVVRRRLGVDFPVPPLRPCCLCGDPGGYSTRADGRPDRTAVARFGRDGAACRACYRRLSGEYGRAKVRPNRLPPGWTGTPAEVKAMALEATRDPGPMAAPTGRLSDVVAAWRRDTDGGRDWLAPWARTRAQVEHGIADEED